VNRVLGLVLAGLLAIGVLAAVIYSIASRVGAGSQPVVMVHGVIGSEKQAYFQDPQVRDVFRRNGLDVQVDSAGSREIATTVDLSRYDFAFPAGVPAAQKIKSDRHASASYVPFFTPMAIATYSSIVQLLSGPDVKVVSDQAGNHYLDMTAYMALVKDNKRWNQITGNTSYPAGKSILITSTDVRTSNSAAMYLSIASYVVNANNIVQDDGTAKQIAPKVAPIFLRQGFTDSSSAVPFDDYLSIGIGKTPMVMIYEAQYVALQLAHDRALTSEMTLMYPSPTVLSKHTLVPLRPAGDRVGRLLVSDPTLQQMAVKYGFRTSDPTAFANYAKLRGVNQPPQLVNIIDPPAFDPLETMINEIDQLYRQGAIT
jgi:hypothetical protein